ncbi:MAG: TonB-dependent receptor [Ignavibacteriales bacterium]|nr:TonB-dependent receptor [Ignavibacteriales bacterium]
MGTLYSRTIALMIVLLLIGVSIVNAQVTTASINGIITDKSEQPLVGATVRAIHGPSGTQYGTISREDGHFNLPGLRVGGPYIIKVTFVGYAPQEKKGIKLELGQSLQVNFILIEEAVEAPAVIITGEQRIILSDGHTGAVSNVSRLNIDNLPSITRTFTDFLKLSPYFVGNNAQGQNNRYNNIQIDGVNFNDLFGLGSSGTPGLSSVSPISLEAIQEFQIAISPYDVRQNGFVGAGVNAITRSGSNDISGAAFLYGRNQSFVGKSPNALKTSYADFNELQTGFRLGGPILKDKLFYFVSAEYTQRNAPIDRTIGAPSKATNVYTTSPDSINLFTSTLKTRYGYDPGSFTNSPYPRRAGKFLVRLDYNIDDQNKLTVRDNFLTGYDNFAPSYSTGSYLYATNSMYQMNNTTNSLVAQLTSIFSNNISNEFIFGYTAVRDHRTYPGSDLPFIVIKNVGDATGGQTNLVAGAEQYSRKNQLDQDIIELTDNFTYYLGNHTLTIGTHNEIFSFRNLYIANSAGYYQFNNLADFVNGNRAYEYQLSYALNGDPSLAAKFKAVQYGFYAQDEWTIIPKLKVAAGVRFDIPTLPDKPTYNYKFDSTFAGQYSTSNVPSGQVLFSPRIGVNYDVFGDRTTQVRAGTGIFSGRVPYVWLSNQYSNTGAEFARLDLYNSTSFVADPLNQPRGNAVQTTEVDVTSKDFKLPQVWRTTVGVDQKLPFDFVGTVEGVWSYNTNEINYQDINLKRTGVYSSDGRPLYGTYNATTKKWAYSRVNATNFTNIILLSNTGLGYSTNLTVQLQRSNTPDGIDANIAYTYGVSKDINSGTSSQAASQFKYNPAKDPNAAVESYSLFDRTHRVMVAASYRYEWSPGYSTTFGLDYSGISGQPYTWLVFGDMNGDGQTSNDLLYIPKDENDIILVSSAGAVLPTTDAAYTRLFNFINNDDYLNSHKGQMSKRNEAHTRWSGQIDLHIGQEIPIIPGHKIEIMFDILNVMNMINSDWGWVVIVPNQTTTNMLNFNSYNASGQPQYTLGSLADPTSALDPQSRWQLQIGVRYSF